MAPDAGLHYTSLAVAPDAEKRYFLMRLVRHGGSSHYHFAGPDKTHGDDAIQMMGRDGILPLPSHNQTWMHSLTIRAHKE